MTSCPPFADSKLTSVLCRMAELIESSENAPAVQLASDKAKLQALERQLGIDSSSASAGPSKPSTSASGQSRDHGEPDPELLKMAQKRKKFDDNTFFETSREINDNVRSAVAAGKPFSLFYH